MKTFRLISFLALFVFISIQCSTKDKTTFVLLKTTEGNIKIELFDDTPLHKENFIKLIKSGFYDGVLFHRVIKDFMIQTGDPNSKNASPDQQLGSGGPGYTIPAEIRKNHFHKKGALAAARIGDQHNPERKSSGSQFYIVIGQKQNINELMADRDLLLYYFKRYVSEQKLDSLKEHVLSLQRAMNERELKNLIYKYKDEVENFYNVSCNKDYPVERARVYASEGGTPHLDDQYTIFGQVIEGIDIAEKISLVETNNQNRPVNDIKIIKAEIVKK